MADPSGHSSVVSPQQILIEAQHCLRQGQAGRVAGILEPLLSRQPASFEAHFLVAVAALQVGDNAPALEHLQAAEAINPSHPAVQTNLGLALGRLGRDQEALQAYERALALNPNDLAALSNMGALLAKGGDHAGAADCFRRGSRLAPDNPAILCNQAASLLCAGRAEQALAPLQRAVALAPNDFMIWFNLAQAQRRCHSLENAVQALQRCRELNPQHSGVWFEWAQVHQASGDLDQAAEAARTALSMDQGDVDGWRLLGNIEKRRGHADQARHAWQQALQIDPSDVASQHLLDALDQRRSQTAPREYVRELFDQYAPRFEHHLRDTLEYQVPEMLAQLLPGQLAGAYQEGVDLGCGTGLMAPLLQPHCRQLHGVDLSERMLQVAERRQLYASLAAEDVVDWLSARSPGTLDLVVAADVLCYIGDLDPVHKAVAEALSVGGHWLFSVEALEGPQEDWALKPSGRFAHSREFLERLCKQHGFRLLNTQSGVGRKDQGENIIVLCVLAERLSTA